MLRRFSSLPARLNRVQEALGRIEQRQLAETDAIAASEFRVFSQWGEDGSTLCELDGTGTGPAGHMVTETLIRSMYAYWKKVMAV